MTSKSKYKSPRGKGWHYESERHRLARLGFKTGTKLYPKKPPLLYKTPLPYVPLEFGLTPGSREFVEKRGDRKKVLEFLKKHKWKVQHNPHDFPLGSYEAWRGQNYLLLTPTHWDKLEVSKVLIYDKDVGERLKQVLRKPYPYRIGEEEAKKGKSFKKVMVFVSQRLGAKRDYAKKTEPKGRLIKPSGRQLETMYSDKGAKVIVTFKKSSPFKGRKSIYRNVTEIHRKYPSFSPMGNQIAFESDIHSTGITQPLKYILSIRVFKEKEKQTEF